MMEAGTLIIDDFNPRPRGEGDLFKSLAGMGDIISIHALAGRATFTDAHNRFC